MPSRKITLRINEKGLLEVLQDLTKLKAKRKFWNRNEIQLTLDLEDIRDTYEYLCKSKRILDWGVGDSILTNELENTLQPDYREEEKPEIKEPDPEPKEKKRKVEKFTDFVSNFTGSSDWSNLSMFILCSWKVAKKSPGIIFGTPLFKSNVLQEYESMKSSPTGSELLLLGKVLESYYYGVEYIDAVEDTVGKIRSSWKSLSTFESLTSVSIKLFKNT